MHEAKFRMVVFRPFASEVILAKVKSSDEEGIRRASSHAFLEGPGSVILVSVGFFDDMYIPLAYLPQPSALYAPRFLSFSVIPRLTTTHTQ